MKYLAESEALKFDNSPTCTVFEYPLGDPDINGAVGIINGRYPEEGFVVNEKCKELIYVLSGGGSITTRTDTVKLTEGGVGIIPAGEEYYFEGAELKIFMPCTPAWFPEQHKEIKE